MYIIFHVYTLITTDLFPKKTHYYSTKQYRMEEKTQIYDPLPYSGLNIDNNYSAKLLSGLGKPTKRGIRKCFSCGVYNGNRSTMCKNKKCGVVLKDSEEKSKVNLDAVKLLTGTERQVFSVRVRDMGPDYRGFVQLPLLQSHSEEDTNIFSEVALCFVNSCQNSFDNSILKCHEEEQCHSNIFCVHINSALKSQSTATAIAFKSEILESLKIADDMKERLLLLATERDGPLVQRISKSVMAVKCQVSPKHPLGYLHFTFLRAKGKEVYEKYYCSCTEFMVSEDLKNKSTNIKYKCIHYYACIWALASDTKYRDEFSHFLSFELPTTQNMLVNIIPNEGNLHIYKNNSVVKNNAVKHVPNILRRNKKKLLKKTLRKPVNLKRCKSLMPKILPIEIKVLNELNDGQNDISWKFIEWLGYVTESINQTMKFENCSILITLVFHLPENFYDCLKKRIPSVYQEIQNGDAVHYNVMNILHLKEIFDTPQIKLKISKKFVHHEQNGYVEYDENEEASDSYQCSFIFFLNVGQSTVDESENTNNSFIIEWLPMVTSLTKVGQLKLQYKYGKKST